MKHTEKTFEKQFQDIFDSLCVKHPRSKVWDDFVNMSACAIANTVDKTHRDTREERYLRCAKGYSEKELECIAELLALVVLALEQNPDQDFLGHIYMLQGFGNARTGQFFTPYHISKCMAKLLGNGAEEIQRKGFITVSDPCCGSGGMLIAYANALLEDHINYQHSALFMAQDIDQTVALMCYIQLSLLGCAGYVAIGDSLANPVTDAVLDEENVWKTPFYFQDVWTWRRIYAAVSAATEESAEIGKQASSHRQLSLFPVLMSETVEKEGA